MKHCACAVYLFLIRAGLLIFHKLFGRASSRFALPPGVESSSILLLYVIIFRRSAGVHGRAVCMSTFSIDFNIF